jgi:hypothetical protein
VNAKDRLDKLEGRHKLSEAERDEARRREEIRRSAEHSNRTQPKDEPPMFTILSGGEVYCSADGRTVTHAHQIAAEGFYQKELRLGHPGLVHDPEKQVLYTMEGEFALSRDQVNLERTLGDKRMEAWRAAEDE